MGHSRTAKAASHGRIVGAAARRFRERGIEGVALAELMSDAGLTHGGFYKHFASRDALVAEAMARAFSDAKLRLTELMSGASAAGLEALLGVYLTEAHRDDLGGGCPVAALTVDASRTVAAREVFQKNFRAYTNWVAGMLAGPDDGKSARAAAVICAMAGAIAVARALGDGALSSAVLEGTRRLVLAAEPAQKRTGGGKTRPRKPAARTATRRKVSR